MSWAGSVSVKLINGWVNRFGCVGLVNAIEFLVGLKGWKYDGRRLGWLASRAMSLSLSRAVSGANAAS